MKKSILSYSLLAITFISIVFVLTLGFLFESEKNHNQGFELTLFISELLMILILTFSGIYLFKTKFYSDKLSDKLSTITNNKTALFVTILLLTEIVGFLFLKGANGYATNSFTFQDTVDSYMDFFNSLYASKDSSAYAGGTIYPPICYVIYGMFASLIPDKMFDNPQHREAAFAIRASQIGQIALIIFFATSLVAFLYTLLFARKKHSNGANILLATVILLSAPSIFAIERGNIILYSLPAITFFLFGYNSENKIIKEIALIALAFSSTLKIIPALFYLLLINEKRYKECARAVLYAVVLFLLPFAYYGGFSQIPLLIKNVFSFGGSSSGSSQPLPTMYHVNTISFSGGFNFISTIFTGNFETQTIHTLGGFILSLVLLAATFFTKGWKRIMCITLVLCGLFRSNTPYVLIYIFPPLISFLNDDFSKKGWLDGIYTFLFLCMCTVFPSLYMDNIGKMPLWTPSQYNCPLLSVVIQNIALVLFAVILIFDISISFAYKLYNKKKV